MSFLFAFILLVIGHVFFLNLIQKLDKQVENERARIAIGQQIISRLENLEKNFYALVASWDNRQQDSILRDIESQYKGIKDAFFILENGGTLDVIVRLNLEDIYEFHHTITYERLPGSGLVLEIVDLKPKLLAIEEKIDALSIMAANRNNLFKNNYFGALRMMRDIQSQVKTTSSFFVRIKENANRLFYYGNSNLEELSKKIEIKKELYQTIEGLFVIIICFSVFSTTFLVARQLHQSTKQLEDARKSMKKAKEDAEAAYEIKSQFLANMSHEIRTPMNGILGMTRLALESDIKDHDKITYYLEIIKKSGNSLLQIINDILDFS